MTPFKSSTRTRQNSRRAQKADKPVLLRPFNLKASPLSGAEADDHPVENGTAAKQAKRIDKAVLALPEVRRVRDRDHVRFVAQQPCLICGRQPGDAHHLRFSQSRALGRKVMTSSPFRSAAAIIARSTVTAMRRRGGAEPESTQPRPRERYGSHDFIHCRAAIQAGVHTHSFEQSLGQRALNPREEEVPKPSS